MAKAEDMELLACGSCDGGVALGLIPVCLHCGGLVRTVALSYPSAEEGSMDEDQNESHTLGWRAYRTQIESAIYRVNRKLSLQNEEEDYVIERTGEGHRSAFQEAVRLSQSSHRGDLEESNDIVEQLADAAAARDPFGYDKPRTISKDEQVAQIREDRERRATLEAFEAGRPGEVSDNDERDPIREFIEAWANDEPAAIERMTVVREVIPNYLEVESIISAAVAAREEGKFDGYTELVNKLRAEGADWYLDLTKEAPTSYGPISQDQIDEAHAEVAKWRRMRAYLMHIMELVSHFLLPYEAMEQLLTAECGEIADILPEAMSYVSGGQFAGGDDTAVRRLTDMAMERHALNSGSLQPPTHPVLDLSGESIFDVFDTDAGHTADEQSGDAGHDEVPDDLTLEYRKAFTTAAQFVGNGVDESQSIRADVIKIAGGSDRAAELFDSLVDIYKKWSDGDETAQTARVMAGMIAMSELAELAVERAGAGQETSAGSGKSRL